MKRIIALYGHANCGKTATLNYLREMIRANGGVSLSSNPPYSEDKPETFSYKDMTICVCPGGDNEFAIQQNLDYSKEKKADIIITASRCRGAGPDLLYQAAQEAGIGEPEWYRKSYENKLSPATQDSCNREYAKVIFDTL